MELVGISGQYAKFFVAVDLHTADVVAEAKSQYHPTAEPDAPQCAHRQSGYRQQQEGQMADSRHPGKELCSLE